MSESSAELQDYEARDIELRIREGRTLADDIARAFRGTPGLDAWHGGIVDALDGLAEALQGNPRTGSSSMPAAIDLPNDGDLETAQAMVERIAAFQHETNELAVMLPVESAAQRIVLRSLGAVVSAFAQLEAALATIVARDDGTTGRGVTK